MAKPRNDINQQKLQAAIARLTDSTADGDSQQQVYYRNPLEVARDEWRMRMDKLIQARSQSAATVIRPTLQQLTTPAPVPHADAVDMAAFDDAKVNWSKQD